MKHIHNLCPPHVDESMMDTPAITESLFEITWRATSGSPNYFYVAVSLLPNLVHCQSPEKCAENHLGPNASKWTSVGFKFNEGGSAAKLNPPEISWHEIPNKYSSNPLSLSLRLSPAPGNHRIWKGRRDCNSDVTREWRGI